MRPGRSEPFVSEKEQPFLIKDLRSLKVLLVQPENNDGVALRSHLERIGCHVQEIWPPPPSYSDEIDIVFVMVDRVIENKQIFHWQVENPSAVLIAVIDYESPLAIDRLLQMRVNAVIGLPIRPFGILTNLLAAVNNHRREQRLRLNLDRLQAKLESCQVIERAKLAIMLTAPQSGKEAYGILRQLAMKHRTTVEAVSSEILSGLHAPEGD
ncbi:ANTAR domain-containing response regulator [Paracoccus aminophilus]|uniref:Two component response regulator n=1 Tax=Paracoccus aminophilus JCM 7686 TaxID=1367847 RepID=S5XTI0_PARAH|nr:ANTAR domain-containing protein [Paracoccus aminophilus]AGT10819.1 two component response regulator [Paracoccus aminophilus JCM 7686]